MIEIMEREMISRRKMFSLLGLAIASGVVALPNNAEAQTSGMERPGGAPGHPAGLP